jgi:hypothetical protein
MAASPLPCFPGAPGPSVLGFLACSAVLRRRAFCDVGGFIELLFFVGKSGCCATTWRRPGGTGAVTERFGQVTLLCSDQNLGALGRNLAVRDIDTPYVAFCDDDTRWRPGALTRAADLLDAHPGPASVTGRILVAPTMVEDPITPELRDSPVPGPA